MFRYRVEGIVRAWVTTTFSWSVGGCGLEVGPFGEAECTIASWLPTLPIYYRLSCRMHIGRHFWKHHKAYWISCSLIQGFWRCFLPSWLNSDALREWGLLSGHMINWLLAESGHTELFMMEWKNWWLNSFSNLITLSGRGFHNIHCKKRLFGEEGNKRWNSLFSRLSSHDTNNSGLQANTRRRWKFHRGTWPPETSHSCKEGYGNEFDELYTNLFKRLVFLSEFK